MDSYNVTILSLVYVCYPTPQWDIKTKMTMDR